MMLWKKLMIFQLLFISVGALNAQSVIGSCSGHGDLDDTCPKGMYCEDALGQCYTCSTGLLEEYDYSSISSIPKCIADMCGSDKNEPALIYEEHPNEYDLSDIELWRDVPDYEMEYACPTPAPACPPLFEEIENGHSSPKNMSYDVDARLPYTCLFGYRLVGQLPVCHVDEVWHGDKPKCEAIPCLPLLDEETFKNGHTDEEKDGSYAHGSTVNYTCNDGFKMGEGGDLYRDCVYNPQTNLSQWSGKPPTCIEIQTKTVTLPAAKATPKIDSVVHEDSPEFPYLVVSIVSIAAVIFIVMVIVVVCYCRKFKCQGYSISSRSSQEDLESHESEKYNHPIENKGAAKEELLTKIGAIRELCSTMVKDIEVEGVRKLGQLRLTDVVKRGFFEKLSVDNAIKERILESQGEAFIQEFKDKCDTLNAELLVADLCEALVKHGSTRDRALFLSTVCSIHTCHKCNKILQLSQPASTLRGSESLANANEALLQTASEESSLSDEIEMDKC